MNDHGWRDVAAAVLAIAVGLACPPAWSEEASPAAGTVHADAMVTGAAPQRERIGISGNPAATNDTTGTGWLGRQLGITKDGVHLGGVWIGAGNYLLSGGVDPGASFNNQLVVDLFVDLERTSGLKGTSFGAQFLQLNTQPTNDDAGSVLGYNGIDGDPPPRSFLARSDLATPGIDGRALHRACG